MSQVLGSGLILPRRGLRRRTVSIDALMQDYVNRTTGAVWGTLFTSAANVNAYRFSNGIEHDPNPAPGSVGSYVRWNPTDGIMGNGCLEMEQLTDHDNMNSNWWRPFNPALSTYNRLNSGGDRFAGEPIYLGLWMKTNCGGNNGGFVAGGGRKAFSFTRTEESYLSQEMVCFDQYFHGAVMMYQGVGRNHTGGLEAYGTVYTSHDGDFDLQPGNLNFSPNFCRYNEVNVNNLSHCIQFDNNQWVWYQLSMIPGTNNTDTAYMKLERWKPGMPSYQTIVERTGLYQGYTPAYNAAYNAVLLWIYETDRPIAPGSGLQGGLKQLYDQIIFSHSPIPRPML